MADAASLNTAISLIIGGISSGKSAFAEKMIERLHTESSGVFYYFTPAGLPRDDEMKAKVAAHKNRRPGWLETVECGIRPAEHMSGIKKCDTVLFDSVGTLVAGCLMDGEADRDPKQIIKDFIGAARRAGINIIFVSEETGMTLVALSESGRAFQKILGGLNQLIAAEADEVLLITAGLPLKLK